MAKATENKAKDVEVRNVKMKLSIKDRVSMPVGLIPKEGDIITLTMARDILGKIQLSQSEIKKSGLTTSPAGGLKWDKDLFKDVEFSSAEMELLKKQVSNLDSKKKITSDLLDMCLKINRG